jgi:hypothetical protein
MKTFLIVDDCVDNGVLLIAALAHRDYRLLETESGAPLNQPPPLKS